MQKPKSFSATLIAAAVFSMSTFFMFAFAGSHEDGGDQQPSFLDQIATGDKEAIGHFFEVNRIEYGLDNFLKLGFHGKFKVAPLSSQFAFLASCIDAHSGHLFIIGTNGQILLSEKNGCQRSVEVKDVSEDGRKALISTDSSGGTGFSSVWERYYFFDGEHFHKGLEYERSSYEAIEGNFIFPGATDWRKDIWALKETRGKIRFLETDQDRIRKRVEVKYSTRHVVHGYDREKDLDGSVLASVGGVVEEVFGEMLIVEKIWVEIWNRNSASHEYLKQ
jgi:hypothetical protein